MLEVMAYNYGNAAGNNGTKAGAKHILDLALWKDIEHKQHHLDCAATNTGSAAIQDVALLSERLAAKTRAATENNNFFITLGGDHSCGIGTWSGASCGTDNLGLLWIDAHLDSHTTQSSDSQNIHGMPVAALLGEGDARLSKVCKPDAKINGKNLCIFGARSYEPAELELLQKHNARIFTNLEINERGFYICLQEAMQVVTNNTSALGLSIDVDGIDPKYAPAVGTPADDGLSPQQIFAIIDACKQHNLLGLEIAEFNPQQDVDHKTRSLITDIITASV